MALTVSQVAKLTGVSVRALHHYDEIGLLRPSGRSGAGYRLYSEGDLERLQQVLFFRALELPLEEIHRIMTDPRFDVAAALRMQRQLLGEKAGIGMTISGIDETRPAVAHDLVKGIEIRQRIDRRLVERRDEGHALAELGEIRNQWLALKHDWLRKKRRT